MSERIRKGEHNESDIESLSVIYRNKELDKLPEEFDATSKTNKEILE